MEVAKLSMQELTAEINRLAAEKKVRDLNEEEMLYREELRARYIELYRQSMLHDLKSIKVVDENGNDVTPEKIKELKAKG